jgi:hypothetical protein
MLQPFPSQKSQLPGSMSQPLAPYLKDATSCADEGIGIRAKPRYSVHHSEQAHVLKKGGLGKGNTDDGGRVAKRQLADEANTKADPKVVPIPLLVLCEAFGHDRRKGGGVVQL